MKLGNWKVAIVLGVIGVLLAAGAGSVLVAGDTGLTDTGEDVAAEVSDGLQYNLTVSVGAFVEGVYIPISGVVVTVWSMEVVETEDNVTITFSKVATGTTDGNGTVSFALSEGDYVLVGNYSGLQAVTQLELASDMSTNMTLHSSQCHEMMADQDRFPEHRRSRGPMVNATV